MFAWDIYLIMSGHLWWFPLFQTLQWGVCCGPLLFPRCQLLLWGVLHSRGVNTPRQLGPTMQRPVTKNDLTQKEARPYFPPAPITYIWRNNTDESWVVRNPPHGEHGERFAKHDGDSFAALTACMVHGWWQFLDDRPTFSFADVPVFIRKQVEEYAALLQAGDE